MIAATVSSARFATGARINVASRSIAARCMKAPEPETDSVPISTSAGGVKDVAAVQLDVPTQAVDTAVLGPVQELINGRAAMLGVVAAAISEIVTGQTVWSQLAGKYVDGEVIERAHGNSTLYFFAVVVIFTMASLAPKLLAEDDKALEPKDEEFGPFSASAEMLNGRAAMLGFAALLAVELVKQSPIF